MNKITVPQSRISTLPNCWRRLAKPMDSEQTQAATKRVPLEYTSREESTSFRAAMVPLVFELYDHICPDLRGKVQHVFHQMSGELQIEGLELLPCELASSLSHLQRICDSFATQRVDLIVITHLSYVPSGQIVEALQAIDTPILLWPFQALEKIVPAEFNSVDVSLNHGVHGTMDLANMLRRAKRSYGVVHGHWREAVFQRELSEWTQVGHAIQTLRNMEPLVIGERFPDMLDLRLGSEPFMQTLGIRPRQVPLIEFAEAVHQIDESAAAELIASYRQRFDIATSLSEKVLLYSAKNELALRTLLEKYQSRAVAVNFLDVCMEPSIAEPLHLAVSNLMAEGIGYGAEGDWETASMVAAFQAALGVHRVGFSEVFSVDYGENRLLLRHWGEGNVLQSAGKPRLIRSEFKHGETDIEFPICDFHYRPARYSLINFNTTPEGNGQIIHLPGQVDDVTLPNCDGARALFKPNCPDVRETLDRYATLGGSHHFVLVEGDTTSFLSKLAQQTGWAKHMIQ